MSWAEFQIRAYAYNRMQEREDLRFREVAWASLIGAHVNPKKLPKTKQSFWQIGINKSSLTEGMKVRMKQAQEQYYKDVKEAKNGR